MDKVLSDLQHAIAGIRTGRASVAVFDGLKVDYYGTPTPINQLANLHVPEPTSDHHPALGRFADRRDRESHPRLRPRSESRQRRQADSRSDSRALTEERRKEIVKRLHHVVEEHRVAARNIRRDANEHLKKLLKDKLISEDDERNVAGRYPEDDRRTHRQAG